MLVLKSVSSYQLEEAGDYIDYAIGSQGSALIGLEVI